jgi:hypothetical protein
MALLENETQYLFGSATGDNLIDLIIGNNRPAGNYWVNGLMDDIRISPSALYALLVYFYATISRFNLTNNYFKKNLHTVKLTFILIIVILIYIFVEQNASFQDLY